MLSATHRLTRSAILLASAVVWVGSVMLCSTRILGESEAAGPATSHSHHEHGAPHDHGNSSKDDDCGCSSFKAFPVQISAQTKAHVPAAAPHAYSVSIEESEYRHAASELIAQNTGPPPRIGWAELVLERCRLSHAPPSVA